MFICFVICSLHDVSYFFLCLNIFEENISKWWFTAGLCSPMTVRENHVVYLAHKMKRELVENTASPCLAQPCVWKSYVNFTIYIICICSHGHSHQNCTQLANTLQFQKWHKGYAQTLSIQSGSHYCCHTVHYSSATRQQSRETFPISDQLIKCSHYERASGHRSASLHGLILHLKLFALAICDEGVITRTVQGFGCT